MKSRTAHGSQGQPRLRCVRPERTMGAAGRLRFIGASRCASPGTAN